MKETDIELSVQTNSVTETDSVASVAGFCYQQYPDLLVSHVKASARKVGPFISRVFIEYIVMNAGIVDSEKSKLNFYLSSDATLNSDSIFVGSIDVPVIKHGEEWPLPVGYKEFRLNPKIRDTELFYLIAIADADNSVIELNETNNQALAIVLKVK